MICGSDKLVTYCLFVYNQEAYVADAVLGALNQTYSPLQIIISDDASVDSTFEIIQELVKFYQGPHEILINKNDSNIGIGAHFSRVVNKMALGEYIICAAGDDISEKYHVEKAMEIVLRYNDVHMIDFNANIINENGDFVRSNTLGYEYRKFTLEDYLNLKKIEGFAPGRIFHKNLVVTFNEISGNCPTEDSVMSLRALLCGGYYRFDVPLLKYRIHATSASSINNLRRMSNYAIYSQYMQDLFCAYGSGLVDEKECKAIAKRNYSRYLIRLIDYSKGSVLKKRILRKIIEIIYMILKSF